MTPRPAIRATQLAVAAALAFGTPRAATAQPRHPRRPPAMTALMKDLKPVHDEWVKLEPLTSTLNRKPYEALCKRVETIASTGDHTEDPGYARLLTYQGQCAGVEHQYGAALRLLNQALELVSTSDVDEDDVAGVIRRIEQHVVHLAVHMPPTFKTFLKADHVVLDGDDKQTFTQLDDPILLDPRPHTLRAYTAGNALFYEYAFDKPPGSSLTISIPQEAGTAAVRDAASRTQGFMEEYERLIATADVSRALVAATAAKKEYAGLAHEFQETSLQQLLDGRVAHAADLAWSAATLAKAQHRGEHPGARGEYACAELVNVARESFDADRWIAVAGCYEETREVIAARDLLRDVLASAELPAARTPDVRKALEKAAARICHAPVIVPPALESDDLVIKVDDHVVSGNPPELDPGTHKFAIGGSNGWMTDTITLTDGQTEPVAPRVPRDVHSTFLLQMRATVDFESDPHLWAVAPGVGGTLYLNWPFFIGPFATSSGAGGWLAYRTRERVTSDIPGGGTATEGVAECLSGMSGSLLVGRMPLFHRYASWGVDPAAFGAQYVGCDDANWSWSWRPSTWLGVSPWRSIVTFVAGLRFAVTGSKVTVQDYQFNLVGPKALLSRDLTESPVSAFAGLEVAL